MRSIILIAHDIRSTHNVGSLLRTAEGLGVSKVIFSGYTPHPVMTDDPRLPHLAQKIHGQIKKTALDAEDLVPWEQSTDIVRTLEKLKIDGYTVVALEQTEDSIKLPDFQPPEKIAILLGREVEGIDPALLIHCDISVEIPMFGRKESFNVVKAAAKALYHCRFPGNL
jgi:tRNA G18 (ribose-2'-O)-methylase SpoU